jgi:hypothetical protein
MSIFCLNSAIKAIEIQLTNDQQQQQQRWCCFEEELGTKDSP